MADNAALHFLPWVRQGTPLGNTHPDTLTPNQPAQVSLPVTVTFSQFSHTVPMRLYGPGDVTAIDPSQIVRIEPRPRTTNFEVNLFPFVEFDRPDFPWLFTPATPGQQERLRPWLCLTVIRKQNGVVLTGNGASALSMLTITTPARATDELPNLTESWAWAHAQVTGAAADNVSTVKTALGQFPERTVSRLLCPRRLHPNTDYYACLVPAFDVGRKAAMGIPVTPDDLATLMPAWSSTTTSIDLPLYFFWEFSTGEEGDFESLARLLQPRPIPDTVGTLSLDIGHPGFGLPEQDRAIVPMHGLLQPVPLLPTPLPAIPDVLRSELAAILNAPDEARKQPVDEPVVAPPIYGAPYPPKRRVGLTSTPPPWLNELNLDPRHRIAAGLGTKIVQQDQDALMASAWQQLSAIQQANLDRRRRQLALVTRTVIFTKHLSRLGNDELLQVTGPSLSKFSAMEGAPTKTMAADILSSEFPAFCLAALRRAARPRGPVNRRALTPLFLSTHNRRLVELLDSLPTGPPRRPFPLRRVVQPAPSLVTANKVSNAAGTPRVEAAKMSAASVQAEPSHGFFLWKTDHWERSSVAFGQEFRQAAFDHLSRIVRPGVVQRPTLTRPNTLMLRRQMNPENVDGGVRRRAGSAMSDEDPLVAYPQFSRPMSERLIEAAPDLLLPGLDEVPANSVTLVQSNNRFIEAFMVGLNHEMGRELLWREYPTDQRGSYFSLFWDQRGAQQGSPSLTLPALHKWTGQLGTHSTLTGVTPSLILLVRGELLRRYPTAVIYAAEGARDAAGRLKPGQAVRYPLFRGSAPPDVTFFGFDLSETQVRGGVPPANDPGWFFVIQQQPGEPSFGLDIQPNTEPPAKVTRWNQLTWRHLVASAPDLDRLSHVPVAQGTPSLPDTSGNPLGAQWGMNAAHMARITWQQSTRIAIHAATMLPPGGPHA